MVIINENNYVDKAEKAIIKLFKPQDRRPEKVRQIREKYKEKWGKMMLSTSQIRNQLAVSADIYNEIMNDAADAGDQLSQEICGRINYLKVRFTYEAGRYTKVNRFVEEAELLKILDSIQGSRKNFLLFNRYMEALVAFHRYYGGKDN